MTDKSARVARRALIGGIGIGAAAIGTELATGARAQPAPTPARWQPALDPQDDWLELPGKHRLAFDTISADGVGAALFFTDNYIEANKAAYGLELSDLATVIIVRHFATFFGYNDAMWAKYGAVFSKVAKFTDPKTKKAPRTNLYNASGYGGELPSHGVTLADLQGKGVRFGVCGAATQAFSGMLAKQGFGKADAIYAELAGNLVAGSHLVPAGIVAVNRTQERGYAISYAG